MGSRSGEITLTRQLCVSREFDFYFEELAIKEPQLGMGNQVTKYRQIR